MGRAEARLKELERLQDKHRKGLPLTDREVRFVQTYIQTTNPEILAQNYPSFRTRSYNHMDINRTIPNFRTWAHTNSGVVQDLWETDEEFEKRVRDLYDSHFRNLDQEAIKRIKYNPAPGAGFFKWNTGGDDKDYLSMASRNVKNKVPHLYTSLDIETDDMGRPISISALKFRYNKTAGEFEQTDRYQRFYKAANRDLRLSTAVHGLTARALSRLRISSKADYSKVFNTDEQAALKNFLGSSTIVGHNILEFDLQKLFGNSGLNNNTIDTLVAARNLWKDQKNDLDSVFQRLFGKTMEQAGLSHHDANADTVASILILQAMANSKEGTAIRYAMSHPDTHIVPYDSQLGSQLASGSYNRFYPVENYIVMTKEEIEKAARQGFVYSKDGKINSGVSIVGADAQDKELLDDVLSQIKDFMEDAKIGGDYLANSKEAQSFKEAMNSFGFWKKGSLTEKLSNMYSEGLQSSLLDAYGLTGNEGTSILDNAKRLQKERDIIRSQELIERNVRMGRISKSQGNELRLQSQSYEDLLNAMDGVIDKNEKLLSIYKAIGNIPMYNFERLEQAFKGEVSGIKGAARGVIPSILYDPLSRITDAGMNGLNAYLANIKASVRATGAIGSGLMGAGMGMLGMGNPVGLGFMIGGGVLKAGTQIWGNAKEAQITRWGENIQNNLNTLGFLQDMILMPFRLLGNALKLATRGLTAFTSGLRFVSNLMSGGLTGLQQMGNPLTGLTGVGYGSYMGSLSADAASLLGAGTLNSVYNDFAAQRMALYTTGKLDTNRLVAASMLGVFNEAYGYTMNEEGSFGNMIDKILASTAGMSDLEKKRTFALANNINPNLGAVLQTMDTLGISTYAGLQRPGGMWGYSQGAYDSFRPGWQRAQWEYQYAGTQWDTTKRRLATSIWNAGGKTIYNAFNETMAAVASGDWEAVGEKIKFIWTTIKEGANSVWDAISETFGLGGKSLSQVIWGGLAKGLTVLRDNILPVFNNIWDSIIDVMIDKFSNFISYLGTIRLDFGELVKAIQGKKHGDILTYLGDTTAMGTWGGIQQQTVPELDRLAQVATAFDVKYGRKFLSAGGYWGPGFGSKHVIEEGGLLGADAYVYDNVIQGFQDWAKRTGELTPDQLADLNSMLADAGFGYAFTGSGDEAFLDFLAQSGQNAAGAAFLHGQWSTESAKRGSVPYRLATELNAIRKKGQDVVGSPILNSLIDYANSKATLDITVNGKGVASMSVAADGSMALTGASNNSLVNVVPSDGSAQYVIESMAQIQR